VKVRSPRVIALEALDKAVAAAELALEKVNSSSSTTSSSKGASRSSSSSSSSGIGNDGMFEVGAEVELGEGFAGAGDAASGPLKPGDIGEVKQVHVCVFNLCVDVAYTRARVVLLVGNLKGFSPRNCCFIFLKFECFCVSYALWTS